MIQENLYTPDCIRTFSGVYINVTKPKIDDIRIEDIAHALSNQPRFGGHLPRFYSVAQHCVMCSELVSREYRLAALLHDASEAYLMDVPSPIKKHLLNYKEIENGLMLAISFVFNFKYPLPEEVKKADNKMLEWEWSDIMLRANDFDCWGPAKAKRLFQSAYHLYC